MKERPILFSGEMVRAILDGRKTMTRRVIKPQPTKEVGLVFQGLSLGGFGVVSDREIVCPYGEVGDFLWVRETWGIDMIGGMAVGGEGEFDYEVTYKADGASKIFNFQGKVEDDQFYRLFHSQIGDFRPSNHMPRRASRITLEITCVRVERVQDITEEDAKAEGVEPFFVMNAADFIKGKPITNLTHRNGFMHLWDSPNAKRGFGWDANPWVWVVEFRRVEK